MALRKICIWPDPELTVIASPVTEVTDEVCQLIDDLFQTMYDANGVGLAATQVAVRQRVLVIDLDPHGDAKSDPELQEDLTAWGFTEPTALINPEIIASEGVFSWDEGCLSVPGITELVDRKETVTVRALDRNGESFELTAHGLFAVAIQHESDHLDGRVFVDYLSKLKRDVIRRKMIRLKAEEAENGEVAAVS